MNDQSEEDSKKVGYCRPPEHGKIKPGEKRNPNGRRGKMKKPKVVKDLPSDVEILARLDSEIVDVQGQKMSKRELELRTQYARSLKGNVAASKVLQTIREKAKVEKSNQGGGVLVVPGMMETAAWEAVAEIQQKQFREGYKLGDHIKTPSDYIQEFIDRKNAERAEQEEE